MLDSVLQHLISQSILRSPRFWLAAQLAAVVVVGFPLDFWKGTLVTDSHSYIAVSQMPLREALSSIRTLGYPFLLKLVSLFSRDYQILPWIHLAMLIPVVFLMEAAVRRFGASAWQSFAVSSGFMYATLQQKYYIASVLTDFPGVVMAGAAIACLFWVVSSSRTMTAWFALAMTTAVSYHIRPAYLFLIVFVPCYGSLLLYIRSKRIGAPFAWPKFTIALTGTTVLPFLGYCLLRLMLVGHFGLVSFGGYAMSGLAVELLTKNTVEKDLTERLRPLAREIIKKREYVGLPRAFQGGARLSLRQYEDNCSTNIFTIAVPAAQRVYDDDRIVYNAELASLSREVILLNKGKYLLWMAYSFPRAVAKLVYRYWIIQLVVPLIFLMFLVRRFVFRGLTVHTTAAEPRQDNGLMPAMFWLAVLYFLTKETLVITSGLYGESRYVVAAGVFVPPFLALVLHRELSLIYKTWRSRAKR